MNASDEKAIIEMLATVREQAATIAQLKERVEYLQKQNEMLIQRMPISAPDTFPLNPTWVFSPDHTPNPNETTCATC